MTLPPLSLYIHLPWCERKCPYCDFNSHEAREIPEREYIEALLRDLDSDLPLARGRTVGTLFIGGGTPSLFSPEGIDCLLRGLGERLSLSPDLEATMEANPGSAEAAKFLEFRQAGINRLSIGIQSFDDERLRALGRIHSGAQARAAVGYAVDAGFDSFNIDLMHGLPGQDAAEALQDLETAFRFEPPHLSWYQLTIEPNTVFAKRPPALPLEDDLADIQELGENALCRSGYTQYEVSAYARPGHACRHNLNYWSFGDYLALGAGAHGKVSGADGVIIRYAKTRGPQDYLRASAGNHTASSSTLNPRDTAGEFMLFSLRLNAGFSTDMFVARTGLSLDWLEPQLTQLVERELLARENGRIRPTDLGRRFLDTVISEFLESPGRPV